MRHINYTTLHILFCTHDHEGVANFCSSHDKRDHNTPALTACHKSARWRRCEQCETVQTYLLHWRPCGHGLLWGPKLQPLPSAPPAHSLCHPHWRGKAGKTCAHKLNTVHRSIYKYIVHVALKCKTLGIIYAAQYML